METCDYCGHDLEEWPEREANAPYDEREFACVMWEDGSQHFRGWLVVDLLG